jgi:hypothetical protein
MKKPISKVHALIDKLDKGLLPTARERSAALNETIQLLECQRLLNRIYDDLRSFKFPTPETYPVTGRIIKLLDDLPEDALIQLEENIIELKHEWPEEIPDEEPVQEYFLEEANRTARKCECCRHFIGQRHDWRDNGGCMDERLCCPFCYQLTDDDFWAVVNKDKPFWDLISRVLRGAPADMIVVATREKVNLDVISLEKMMYKKGWHQDGDIWKPKRMAPRWRHLETKGVKSSWASSPSS